MNQTLFFEASAWYLPLCLLVAALYAFFLYQKTSVWSENVNRALAGVRFVLVFLLCLLLLGIFLKQNEDKFEDPLVVLALDNSESIALNTPQNDRVQLEGKIKSLKGILEDKGFQVQFQTLEQADAKLDSFDFKKDFKAKTSNLAKFLSGIENQYENQNLAGVLLLSDGIVNQGTSPDFNPYKMSIQTVGLGDTTERADIALKTVLFNKISYLGNQFPLLVEWQQNGFAGKTIKVSVLKNGTILKEQSLTLAADGTLQRLDFQLEANEKGVQHYQIKIENVAGEVTYLNNERNIYIEVLDNKEKILIAAPAPHPDIKALRAALEKNDIYQVDLFIPDIFPLKKDEKYNLVIFHQYPNEVIKKDFQTFEMLQKQANAAFYIVGSQTNLNALNLLGLGVQVRAMGKQSDKVFPSYNSSFNKFQFDDKKIKVFADYPPAEVPFAEYTLGAGAEVLLYQRIGNVVTKKPLLVTNQQNDKKIALLLAENTWGWRLQEYAKNENADTFDELITKLVQYLATKEDKKRFRLKPNATEYFEGEAIAFEVETYNASYEPITGQKIELLLKDAAGKNYPYSFVNNTINFKYLVNSLKQGTYQYSAKTILDGKVETETGEFIVKELALEAFATAANHALLRKIANQNKGEFFNLQNWSDLEQFWKTKEATQRLHRTETTKEILKLPWLFAILVLLATIEWFFRKYKGGY
ncbi:hypothetical protein [Hugenholtzia roseola]|uniref:hypothetical protein n=1 Tax=Hugenholtzia roseola TaxID=1002 RepID=UPI0003FF90AC|nr:hypothetical protein [Hugenholtzia roseola]